MGASLLAWITGRTIGATVARSAAATVAAAGVKKALTPKVPNMPSPPTIDQAALTVQQTDRLRHRRGVQANIYAGAAPAPPAGKQTLGG